MNLLKIKNLPNIINYKNNNTEIKIDEMGNAILLKNNEQWMTWNPHTQEQLSELYSHYFLAEGHCICTGMGFLLRENWILQKKEVTKLTVIEINNDLIDYHKKFNKHITDKIEIINCDVYNYKGKCDTLLIDNFEGVNINNSDKFLTSVQIINNSISSKIMWFWPLEIILAAHYTLYIGMTLKEIYEKIKKYFQLNNLPDLSEEQLFYFCAMYNNISCKK
jgi:hypothetical protein